MQTSTIVEPYSARHEESSIEAKHSSLVNLRKEYSTLRTKLKARQFHFENMQKKRENLSQKLYAKYPLNEHGEHAASYYSMLSDRYHERPIAEYMAMTKKKCKATRKKPGSISTNNTAAIAEQYFTDYMCVYNQIVSGNFSAETLVEYRQSFEKSIKTLKEAINSLKEECGIYDEYNSFYKEFTQKYEAYVNALV